MKLDVQTNVRYFTKRKKKLKTPIWQVPNQQKINKNPTIPKYLMFYLNINFNNIMNSNLLLVFYIYSYIFMLSYNYMNIKMSLYIFFPSANEAQILSYLQTVLVCFKALGMLFLPLTTGYKQKVQANSQDRKGQGYFMISLWGGSITNLNLKKETSYLFRHQRKKCVQGLKFLFQKDIDFLL